MQQPSSRTIIAAIAVLLGLATGGVAEAGTVNGRQARQQARIGHGVASGALTPREAVRLERREAALARREAVMRRTGGGLSCRERTILDRRLDRLSVAIRREKHDRQRRR